MIESELVRLEGIAAAIVSKQNPPTPESRRLLAGRIATDRLSTSQSSTNRPVMDRFLTDGSEDEDDIDPKPESASDLIDRMRSKPRRGGSASFSGPAPPRDDPDEAARSGPFRRYREIPGSIVTDTETEGWLSIETHPNREENRVSLDLGINGIEAGATLDTANARSIGEALVMAAEELDAMDLDSR